MQNLQCEVKSKGKVVGVATFPSYDSYDELVASIEPDEILDMCNAMLKTKAQNRVRQSAGKPTKAMLRVQAQGMLTVDEITSVIGDGDALERLLQKKMAELESQWEASTGMAVTPEAPQPGGSDADDDDEDEDI